MRRIEYRDFELEESSIGIYATALGGSARLVAFNMGQWHDMKGTPVLWRDYDLELAKQKIDNMYRTYERDYYEEDDAFAYDDDSLYGPTYSAV